MTKRMIIMLIAVGVVLGAIFTFEAVLRPMFIKRYLASLRNPVETVSDMTATEQPWQKQLQALGSLRAVRGANLSAQVGGIVSAIHFKSGTEVAAGTLLVQLDDKEDVAKLDQLKAQATLARITYERDLRQLRANAVSRQVVDTDEQNLKADEAAVAEQQATVNDKSVRAPFAGKLGLRQVDLGQYLAPGTTMVGLQALDPLYVDFTLPQQALAEISVGQPVKVRVDTYPNEDFTGTISAINSAVDTATRNLQVRATIRNPGHRLLPGMFATVTIDVGAPQRYVTLRQTAITYNPYGSTVFLVEDKGKGPDGQPELVVNQTFVTTGETRGDQVVIVKGITPGQRVVTAGQMKLHNGTRVRIDNTVQTLNNPHPQVPDE